jgi:hypothetical protein
MAAVIAQCFPMIAVYTQSLPFVFLPETRGVELESMDKTLEQKSGAPA